MVFCRSLDTPPRQSGVYGR